MTAEDSKVVRLFDIQRASVVDGPGVRTTVFFKGCNLKCAWCHNPEGQSSKCEIMVHKNRCTGCGTCLRICPNHFASCDLCGKCADYCPHGAREMVGREMTVQDIYEILDSDRAYYESSGGGATFSGGECMLQLDALCNLLKKCKEEGIPTAVDTAGCVPWNAFEQVDSYTDLYLYDLKCADDELHKKYVGASNQLILANLHALAEKNPDKIIVRIPVIPSVNANEKEMRSMAEILRENGIKHVELLPYHKMGNHKYEALGMNYTEFEIPSKEEMTLYQKFFESLKN